MDLLEICNLLSAKNIHYALVGGHAVSLHGAVRGTLDIDFIIKWEKKNLERFVKALEEMNYQSELPLKTEQVFNFKDDYIKNRSMIAWCFKDPNDPSRVIDLIITEDLKGKRVKKIKIKGVTVPLLSLKDLIAMKKKAGRPQDQEDVKALEKLL